MYICFIYSIYIDIMYIYIYMYIYILIDNREAAHQHSQHISDIKAWKGSPAGQVLMTASLALASKGPSDRTTVLG